MRTRDNYHDLDVWPELSATALMTAIGPAGERNMADYAAQYVHRTVERGPPTPAMEIGSVVHAILLQGREPDDLLNVWPEYFLDRTGSLIGPRADRARKFLAGAGAIIVPDVYLTPAGNLNAKGKIWASEREAAGILCATRAEYQALESLSRERPFVVKQSDHDLICGAVQAVRHHEVWKWIERAVCETPITWEEPVETQHGEYVWQCKACPDWVNLLPDRVIVCDLKVTPNVRPSDWRKAIRRFRYWLQLAHYHAGLTELHARPVDFRWVCVDPGGRHAVAVHQLDAESIFEAHRRRDSLMADLAVCHQTGDWTDDWSLKLNEIKLTEWDF